MKEVEVLRAFLVALLLAALAWSGVAVAAVPFERDAADAYPRDLAPGHWAYDTARRLASRGILKGFPDATFRGNAPVNRHQLAIAIDQAVSQLECRMDRLETRPPARPRSAPAPGKPRTDPTHAVSLIDEDDSEEEDPAADSGEIIAAAEHRRFGLPASDAKALAELTREFSRELSTLRLRTAASEVQSRAQRRDVDVLRTRVDDLASRTRREEAFRFVSGELRLVGFNVPALRSFTNLILNFGYHIGDRITGVFSPQLTNEFDGALIDKLDVWEAYADFHDFGFINQARVGRQLMLVGAGLTLFDRVEAFNFTGSYADLCMQVMFLGDVMLLAEGRNFADQAYGFYYIEESRNGLGERPLHLGAYVKGKIGEKLYVGLEYANFSNRIATPINNNHYTQGYMADVIWDPSPRFRWRQSVIASEEDFRAVAIDRDLAFHSAVSSPLEDVLQMLSQATNQIPVPLGRNEINGFWDLKTSLNFDLPHSRFRLGLDWDRVRDFSTFFDNARNGFDLLAVRLRRTMSARSWLELRARKLHFNVGDGVATEGTLDIPRVDRSDVRLQWFGRF